MIYDVCIKGMDFIFIKRIIIPNILDEHTKYHDDVIRFVGSNYHKLSVTNVYYYIVRMENSLNDGVIYSIVLCFPRKRKQMHIIYILLLFSKVVFKIAVKNCLLQTRIRIDPNSYSINKRRIAANRLLCISYTAYFERPVHPPPSIRIITLPKK